MNIAGSVPRGGHEDIRADENDLGDVAMMLQDRAVLEHLARGIASLDHLSSPHPIYS